MRKKKKNPKFGAEKEAFALYTVYGTFNYRVSIYSEYSYRPACTSNHEPRFR